MTLSNPWFVLAITGILVLYHLELIATLLNMSALKAEVPAVLKATVSEEDHERALEYARVSARFDVMESSVSLGVFMAFWWLGGFPQLDGVIRSWHLGVIQNGLMLIAGMMLLKTLMGLPFEVYRTFVIEKQFGFNKTTVGTFVMDRVKSLALAILLGAPLLAVLLWLFDRFEMAALYGWLVVSGFSLVMAWLAPRLILPLFYKFQPLPDESLRAAIMSLAEKLRFPVEEISVVDGSRRSTKANAFFSGFGKTKRIALFDTLINNHTQPEILAVLAHEIGHNKRGHVPKQMALGLLVTGVMFAMLHFGLRDWRLCAAFGINVPSAAWGLIFFSIIYEPVNVLLGLISGHLSRQYEFEADSFAREALGGAEAMSGALMKLSRDHLSNPTPHPFYVFLHYSHPPVLQRLEALGKKEQRIS